MARLLCTGSYDITWNELAFAVPLAEPAFDPALTSGSPLEVTRPLVVKVGDQEIRLGAERLVLGSARVVAVTPTSDGHHQVRLVPGDDTKATVLYTADPPTA